MLSVNNLHTNGSLQLTCMHVVIFTVSNAMYLDEKTIGLGEVIDCYSFKGIPP